MYFLLSWHFLCVSLNTHHTHQPKKHTKKYQVGLLVIDSLGFPFRQDAVFQTETPLNTARVVGLLARELCRMAQDRGMAVRKACLFFCFFVFCF
jgi:hypothetical protein